MTRNCCDSVLVSRTLLLSFKRFWVFIVATVCCLISTDILAQTLEDNTVFGPLSSIESTMRSFQSSINALMLNTFWLLATIEFAFALLMLALHDEGIQGFFREIVIRILFVGFFYTLYQNGIDWMTRIIDTLTDIGAQASGINALAPDQIIDLGIDLMKRSAFEFSIWDAGSSVALLIAAMITFIALLIVAANFALVLAEFYIVGYGGIFLLALGGSRWTRDYALAYMKYVFSAGMRIFIMLVISGLGYTILLGRIEAMAVDNLGQWWAILAFAIILAILATRAPNAIVGLLAGISNSSNIQPSQALRSMGAVVSTASSAASGSKSIAGAGAAAIAATQLGSAQRGNTALNTVGNLAKAAGTDFMTSVKGTKKPGSVFPGSGVGTVGGRMAANLKQQLSKQRTNPATKK